MVFWNIRDVSQMNFLPISHVLIVLKVEALAVHGVISHTISHMKGVDTIFTNLRGVYLTKESSAADNSNFGLEILDHIELLVVHHLLKMN